MHCWSYLKLKSHCLTGFVTRDTVFMGIIFFCRDKNIFGGWSSQATNSYWYFLKIWGYFSSKVGFKLMLVCGRLYQVGCLSCAWAVKEIRPRRALLDCCLYLLQPPCCTSFPTLIRFRLKNIFRFTDGCSRNIELFRLETFLLSFEVICVTKWHPYWSLLQAPHMIHLITFMFSMGT